jgi:hypothetical protein
MYFQEAPNLTKHELIQQRNAAIPQKKLSKGGSSTYSARQDDRMIFDLVTLNSALFLDHLWQVLRTHSTNTPFTLDVHGPARIPMIV